MPDNAEHLGLRLEGVAIRLGGTRLLALSAQVEPGETLTIMGASGSGKSSLIALIGGFLDPAFAASGHVFIGAREITELPTEQRRVGVLFQDPLLFPHLSTGENLLFAIPPALSGRRERRQIAEKALSQVGLDGFFDRDPDTLSGGQKARVALQRVMISAPEVLLLDEPFSKLDTSLRQQTRRLVFDRAQAERIPVVLVTHDHADAEDAGGTVVHLESMV
ncbi:ATP-binding cassette domain-containing protein [Pararhizobium sp.]|uniref:ATP-binding cassette domain-containing protein n=1 Tax=Pararhizobium sp. TaxID=1977563 RepID=UPI0027239259|nr:ATP-binding cassette domain-containing protein [Pararhizobium sp.]MDO9416865.1 ATP-binding cassette domain-containing protein [Pararhizobium sp.]